MKDNFNIYKLSREEVSLIDPDNIMGFDKVYSGGALRDIIGSIKQTIKEIGHTLYAHRDINNPDTGKNYYDSFNHYQRIASLIYDDIKDVEYYGRGLIPENRNIKYNLKNNLGKIDKFVTNLETIEFIPEVKEAIGSVDADALKNLNLELNKLLFEARERVWTMNYFKKKEINDLDYYENLPEPDFLSDYSLSNVSFIDEIVPDLSGIDDLLIGVPVDLGE